MKRKELKLLSLREFYYTENFNINHSTYGGEIYLSDFETDYRGKNNTNGSMIAKRIEKDFRFDKECIKNAIFRNKQNVARENTK